ncbi:DNA-binding CsgD family transcriptional regulator [Kibdelosporangium banguiense]|uniref:DNA-binding CsgD family transcriptional regulator n=1 Tax=Kibdelosporangium banguiense TaxID=1365924 RepID=A0ABS4TRM8_9PSEU|nr:LuxR C-terminal-related transcriptional regulator [Kibdelosporangium banguiense]MBP2326600.1 DNA-binding CsgD family transcriptional regulator [Kibdelosporangium banguiense]
MRTGLTSVLSASAATLYERLIVSGGLSLVEHPDLPASSEARELIDKGFARERYVDLPRLVPVEPIRAVDNAILTKQRQILDQYQTLLHMRDEMQALQQVYRSSVFSGEPGDLVRVITDPQEIGALSVELCLSAQYDVVSLETEHFTRPPDPRSARSLPAEVLERGVCFRNIYSRAALEVPGATEMLRKSQESGWLCRVYPHLPMKLVLVDERAALLPLGPTGMEGAALVRSPVITAALRTYFELLWSRAVSIDGTPAKVPPEQDQVLRLVLTGMTDGAIARSLGISERTVRRHVQALLKALGATNRVTLAVAAVREGWVD